MPFENPYFVVEGDSPGEAEDWTWTSYQAVGGWAEYNTAVGLERHKRAIEIFSAGWMNNEDWFDDLDGAAIALFNATITAYQSTTEIFSIWGETWPGFTWSGLPWRESWTFVPPAEDTIGPGPTGFRGWYDAGGSTMLLPMETESFGEAWGTDPLFWTPGFFMPGTAYDGVLKGNAVTFPLFVPPGQNHFTVWVSGIGFVNMIIPSATYATATALAAAIQAQFAVAAPPVTSGLEFSAWQDGEESGIQLGNTLTLDAMAVLGCPDDMSKDLRPTIGFSELGPTGKDSMIRTMEKMLDGTSSTRIIFLDSWSYISFTISTDFNLGTYLLPYSMAPATFDFGETYSSVIEIMTLDGWTGLSWLDGYEAGETPGPTGITEALFDSGITSIEIFGPLNWPDELWT